ncbi:MAG: radical SAM protein [Chitinivibrionales bacterium]|nr:radical SAM protein [Chitinivibrionales bacterium]
MNILALNPPFLPKFSRASRSPAVAKSGTFYYPLWLAMAVGYLEKQGHTLLFIDAPAEEMSLQDVIDKAVTFGPALAVLDTSTPSIYSDVNAAAELKKAIPGLFTVLVGVHVSALAIQTLELAGALDAVAFGEYDETLAQLAAVLEKTARQNRDEALTGVAGLAFRTAEGTIRKNGARAYIEDLDAIPFVSSVYKKHLPLRPYFYSHSRHPLVVIVTGRGCPFQCTYCVIPQTLMGHRYRKRSLKNVVDEFLYIKANFPQVKEIMVEDDTLTADKVRCRELMQALIAAGATTIPWSANARADVDEQTMRLMKKAGCRLFCVGFESGDQQILDNIKKSTNLATIRDFVRDAKRVGILIHGCFMVGNRGETKATLQKTLDLALKLNPDTAQFYPIMAYPGTADFDYYGNKGWIVTKDFRRWLTPEGLHSSVVSNPDLPYEYLVDFCDHARRAFYLRPAYIARKLFQAAHRPTEARRIIMAGLTFMRYLFAPSRTGKKDL